MSDLSHFDEAGASRMVDVGDKPVTRRRAVASGTLTMQAETLRRIRDFDVSKGNVLEVARLAGMMAAKRTAELIPLCHTLPLSAVDVAFDFPEDRTLSIQASVAATAQTGVEMEALTAVCVTALTVYDMCKSLDRTMTIASVRLEEKSGGQSGHFVRPDRPGHERTP